MRYELNIRDKTVFEQMTSIKYKYPNFITSVSRNVLGIKGQLQPTSRSDTYTFKVIYKLRNPPEIKILNPILIENCKADGIEHTYPGKKLCLYQPKYKEFSYSDYISETIIPWISLWLYHYEVWHIIGDWLGGGEHPGN